MISIKYMNEAYFHSLFVTVPIQASPDIPAKVLRMHRLAYADLPLAILLPYLPSDRPADRNV